MFLAKFYLKFVFYKKATNNDKIFTVNLTLCSKCQIYSEDFVNFCGLLRKHELYHFFNEYLSFENLKIYTYIMIQEGFILSFEQQNKYFVNFMKKKLMKKISENMWSADL